MIKQNKTKVIFLLLLLFPALSFAESLENALNNTAKYFRNSGKIPTNQRIMISEIINYHSKQKDQLSSRIETGLYFAFENQFPEVRLVDAAESVAGISMSRTVFIKGSYQQKGEFAVLRLRAIQGLEGDILDQTTVEFATKFHRKALVAVLDIEATILNEDQRKILSDVFREALGETGAFDLASTADIDKMNPDQIQKATGCTRDTCATVIGEQLGVDRVISSSFRKLDIDYYYLSARIIDIKDGSILAAKTVKHSGNLRTIDIALKTLAIALTKKAAEKVRKPVAMAAPKPINLEDLVVVDTRTGLVWQKDEGGQHSWQNALRYCERLELAGERDWRLPDKQEIGSSHSLKEKFPGLMNSSHYWSSTANAEEEDEAWGMTVENGSLFDDGEKDSNYHVRCVRGRQSSDSLLVADENTGLVWQKREGGKMEWEKAMRYCRGLNLIGKTDWRLPNKDELATSFALKERFPGLANSHYWSSTTSSEDDDDAWGMTVDSGSLFDDGEKDSNYYVRCLRGRQATEVEMIADSRTGLFWQKKNGGKMKWAKAIGYCRALNLSGKTDWRLPNKNELASSHAMRIRFHNRVEGYYWSSTVNDKRVSGMTASNGRLFDDGRKNKSYHVRCVRGRQSSAALVVADSRTGLFWQKEEAGKMKWSKAIGYCRSLNLAGKDDWRLPDKDELASSHALRKRFPYLAKGYYWSSTNSTRYKGYAWGLTTSSGEMFSDGSKKRPYYVRCVRGRQTP